MKHLIPTLTPFCSPADARQMANAPRRGNGAPPAGESTTTAELDAAAATAQQEAAPVAAPALIQTKPGNRFDHIFSAIIFKPADGKIYENERNKSKQRKIANVLVELAGSGTYLAASVYATQAANKQKPIAEFKWFGANMQVSVRTEDPASKAEMDAWKRNTALKAFHTWFTANPTTASNVAETQEPEQELDGITL